MLHLFRSASHDIAIASLRDACEDCDFEVIPREIGRCFGSFNDGVVVPFFGIILESGSLAQRATWGSTVVDLALRSPPW